MCLVTYSTQCRMVKFQPINLTHRIAIRLYFAAAKFNFITAKLKAISHHSLSCDKVVHVITNICPGKFNFRTPANQISLSTIILLP